MNDEMRLRARVREMDRVVRIRERQVRCAREMRDDMKRDLERYLEAHDLLDS